MSLSNQQINSSVDGFSTPGELADVRLPATSRRQSRISKSDVAARRAERQLDLVIDLLATEQALGCGQEYEAGDEPKMIELSIIMPCLNQADTVGNCVLKAQYAFERLNIVGEVIVVDSGSRDDSVEIAESLGAQVVHADSADYITALRTGMQAAQGNYWLIGDADDSFDFSQAGRFYDKLLAGADIAQGCRLAASGGRIMPNATSTRRRIFISLASFCTKPFRKVQATDAFCSVKAISRAAYERIGEDKLSFTTHAGLLAFGRNLSVSEVPIAIHPVLSKSGYARTRFHDFVTILRKLFV